jgi:hypothetical protein
MISAVGTLFMRIRSGEFHLFSEETIVAKHGCKI